MHCDGSGKRHVKITYKDFVEKKKNKDIKHVIETNPGFVVGTFNKKEGIEYDIDHFGGMPYEDWFAGKPFPPKSEMRKHVCPARWYQGVDYDKKPNWEECLGYGAFTDCDHFKDKDKCWERWDKEFG